MNPVMFRLELDDPDRAGQVAELVERRLRELDDVEQAQAEPEELHDLAATVTVVAAAVSLTPGGSELVAQARRFIEELKGLLSDIHGLGRAVVVVGAEEVELDDLTDQQLAEVVE